MSYELRVAEGVKESGKTPSDALNAQHMFALG